SGLQSTASLDFLVYRSDESMAQRSGFFASRGLADFEHRPSCDARRAVRVGGECGEARARVPGAGARRDLPILRHDNRLRFHLRKLLPGCRSIHAPEPALVCLACRQRTVRHRVSHEERTYMQVLSLIWGLLALLGMFIGIIPCLGALNWLNIPFAVAGLIVSL